MKKEEVEQEDPSVKAKMKRQEMIIKQVYIDGADIVANLPRVHGARFYYDEVNSAGKSIGNDDYICTKVADLLECDFVQDISKW